MKKTIKGIVGVVGVIIKTFWLSFVLTIVLFTPLLGLPGAVFLAGYYTGLTEPAHHGAWTDQSGRSHGPGTEASYGGYSIFALMIIAFFIGGWISFLIADKIEDKFLH